MKTNYGIYSTVRANNYVVDVYMCKLVTLELKKFKICLPSYLDLPTILLEIII